MQGKVSVRCGLTLLCGLLSFAPVANARQVKSVIETPMSKEQAIALSTLLSKPWNKVKAGDALFKQGDLEGAIREYQSSLQLSDKPETHIRLARAFSARGSDTKALQQYRLALAKTPLPDVDIALEMALDLARMKRFDEAITLYRVGMRLPIEPAKAIGALGGTLLTPGYDDYRRRIAAREAARELSLFDLPFSPNTFDARLFEAAVRTGLGKNRYHQPDAIVQLDQAIHLAPDFAPAYFYRGEALRSRGKYTEARVMFEKAASIGGGEIIRMAKEALSR